MIPNLTFSLDHEYTPMISSYYILVILHAFRQMNSDIEILRIWASDFIENHDSSKIYKVMVENVDYD